MDPVTARPRLSDAVPYRLNWYRVAWLPNTAGWRLVVLQVVTEQGVRRGRWIVTLN